MTHADIILIPNLETKFLVFPTLTRCCQFVYLCLNLVSAFAHLSAVNGDLFKQILEIQTAVVDSPSIAH